MHIEVIYDLVRFVLFYAMCSMFHLLYQIKNAGRICFGERVSVGGLWTYLGMN